MIREEFPGFEAQATEGKAGNNAIDIRDVKEAGN